VLEDLRGRTDSRGRVLEATITALGDELASAAELVKGKSAGLPVAVVRGLGHLVGPLDLPGARALQRPAAEDLFRLGADEAWREGYQAALAEIGRGPQAAGAGWSVVIPVKPAEAAKSRLSVPGIDRVALARAIAVDTVAVAAGARGIDRVLVVTADADTARALAALPRVEVVPDTAQGLRAAIALGLRMAGEGVPRAVLLGDIPAAEAWQLDHALRLAATAGRAFVPDAEETGTVLATARPGVAFEPLFGEGSAAAHASAGFTALELPASWGLRRDVDTAEQLALLAAGTGLGPRTAALLA